MSWTPEERAHAQRTADSAVEQDIAAFLRDWRYDQPFQPERLAEHVTHPKFDVLAAHRWLMAAKDSGTVHYASGGWYPGPMPRDSRVDQL